MDKKEYNLENRTLKFAKNIIQLCKKIEPNQITRELVKQIIRSSCSVGANYREANESLSKKDLQLRLRIARKECKETSYWLCLLEGSNPELSLLIKPMYDESLELRNILTAIITKTA